MKKGNIFTHLAAAIVVTILTALIYASVQQVHRSSANDPQLQISRDISDKLNTQGGPIDKWFDNDSIDISRSLAVFTTLYNYKDEPVVSTGLLNGKKPSLPRGVFDFAKSRGENVFTWQPESGVRVAVVLKSVQSPEYSFVAVGRSLLEVEKREKDLLTMTIISWLLAVGIIMLHCLIDYIVKRTT
jgi:hypothetical protein